MPRKAATDPSAAPVEPRRSSRISAKPKPAQPAEPEKKPRKTSKKRTAEESQQDGEEDSAPATTTSADAKADDEPVADPKEKEDKSNKKVCGKQRHHGPNVDFLSFFHFLSLSLLGGL